jgi:hypothetical protein
MKNNTTQPRTLPDVEAIDAMVLAVEDYLKQLKHVRTQVQNNSQPSSATTSRRRKKITPEITEDIRSALATQVQSVIERAQTILVSLSPPPLNANTAQPNPTGDRSPIAHDRTARNDKKSAQELSSRPGSTKNRRTPVTKRVQFSQGRRHSEDTNEEEDAEETAQDLRMNANEKDAAADGDSGTSLAQGHNESSSILPPSAIDQPENHSTRAVSIVPDGICELSDLGLYTVPTLEKHIAQDGVQRTGICHLRVSDFSLKNSNLDVHHIQDANRTTTRLKYNTVSLDRPGIMKIYSDSAVPPTVPCSTFTQTPRVEYTHSELEAIYESFCNANSTSTPQWYVIGPSKEVLGEQYRDFNLLSPGPYLQQCLTTVIEGVNSTYVYASYSQGQTATAMHYEDCHWGSINLMLYGAPKLWLSVEPADNKALEDGLRKLFPESTYTCSQRVRHLDVLLAPSVLRQLGVKYHVKACYPGELIFTTQATYHQIINMGANVATAINFMDSKTPPYPMDYIFCSSRICGVTESIGLHHFRSNKRSRREEIAFQSLPRKKSCQSAPLLDLVQLQHYSLGLGEQLFHELERKSPANILVSILSKQTVRRLSRLLYAQRLEHYNEFKSPTAETSLSTPTRQAAAHHRAAKSSLEHADLSLLHERVNTHAYVQLIEIQKGHRETLGSELITEILTEQKVPSTPDTRRAFIRDLSTGRKWLSLCKVLGPGLLALLPLRSEDPYRLSSSALLKMSDTEITAFNNLVTGLMTESRYKKTLEILCAIANGLVERIAYSALFQYGLVDPSNMEEDLGYDAKWLTSTTRLLSKDQGFDLQATLSSLRPHPYLSQNKPANRQTDPTLTPEASAPCSQAIPTQRCMCVRLLRLDQCRTHIQPMDRQTSVRSCVALNAGESIGELTGMLYHTDHKHCSGTFCALSWPEKPLESICHLHWEDFGNWVRLVPYSCDPCAEFTLQIVGCRLRVMLKAKSDIAANSNISADWRTLPGQTESKLQQCIRCEGPCSSLALSSHG